MPVSGTWPGVGPAGSIRATGDEPGHPTWTSWPEILARAISGLRAATGYPHVYSIAAHANAPRKDLGNRGACPTTRHGAAAVVIRTASGVACGWARRLRQHRLVG